MVLTRKKDPPGVPPVVLQPVDAWDNLGGLALTTITASQPTATNFNPDC